MSELLIGCGFARQKLLGAPGTNLQWQDLVTLDHNYKCLPDIECDLNDKIWLCRARSEQGVKTLFSKPGHAFLSKEIKESFFSEVHAYEVLEHLGSQGDAESFFATFRNIHRILVPGGFLFGTCPSRYSAWAWGDPSHRRIISQESLVFLSQEIIASNRKANTAMSDFSDIWDLDFKIIASSDNHQTHTFCLQAIK